MSTSPPQDRFDEFLEPMKEDTPKLRVFLVQCTKIQSSQKNLALLLRKIDKDTNSRVIKKIMSECWNMISTDSKKQIADLCNSIELERVALLGPNDHYYD